MADHAEKGREYVEKADKKLRGFSLFSSSSAKNEEAAELLERAATQFKLAQSWEEAAQVYRRLTELHVKLDSRTDAAAAWVEASRAFTKAGKRQEAKDALRQAISVYTDMGRLGMAARHIKGLAEETEKGGGEGDKAAAVELYSQAAQLFAAEDSNSEASKCRQKVAFFSAEAGDYATAIGIFEDVARAAAENNLLKFSARGHLLNAGICHLAGSDQIAIQRAIEKYEDIDLQFAGSREGNLFRDLAGAMEEGDVEAFADKLAEFDSMTRLDPWKTNLLLKVKQRIETGGHGDGDEPDLS